ncbi:uncharacterized protein LOC124372135 [Homalodisca vitripennis]|uniref:uncharacterized protein LOC124372135 n=1 Tax=Homalodisca vitripennis TaxID=197043 RepID=UPI001EEA4F7F|nr:uncharacterized protein LOC124372135 [Homalodisca vitripennis]
MLNCDSVNQALDLDANDPEPGPSSRVEKQQDLNDDDSGSETGSESMLNCDSINQALDLDVNDSGPGPSSRRMFGGEESGHISESVLDDSSVLEHKNKDIEESHNQVIDASGDETEDDEFFVLPSQTVKEFKSNRKDKSNKMADLSLTEDIFDPSVVAKHYKNKDSSTSKLEINSSKDIFELETQGDDFDGVCKSSVGVPEDRNLMDIDTECVFNTEAQLTVRDQNNQDDTSIFEAETQEMGLSQLQIQKAEKSCDIDIFDAESELAECQRELHNKNKEFESSGKENVKNEDKLNDMNKSGTDNVNSSNALEEDEISDLALSAVLSQVNSSLESLKASNNGLKDITKELTQPNADNKDQENGSGSIVAHKEQKCNYNILEQTKIKATVKTNTNTSLVNTAKCMARNEDNSGTSKNYLNQDGLKMTDNQIGISETCSSKRISSNEDIEEALTQINTKLVENKESGCDTYQENRSLELANQNNLAYDKSIDPPILNINKGNQKAQTEKSTDSSCFAGDSDKAPLLNSTMTSSEDPNLKCTFNNIKSEFEIKKEIFSDINSDEDDNFSHEATQVNLNICDVKKNNSRIFEHYEKGCKKEQSIDAEETQLNLNLYNLFAETEVNEGNLKNKIDICEAETQPNLQLEKPSLNENDSTDMEDEMEMHKSTKLTGNEFKKKITKHEFDICEAETQPNLLLEKSILEENGRTNMEDEVGFEAETQLNVRLEKPNLDKNGRINVEDDTGFEAETQLNVGLEKPSLDRNGKTNVEDEVGFEAETQLNVRLEKPSLDRNGKTNVEDDVGFEAETQLNVRLEKPSLDKSGRTNVEDDVGFEAETQLNVGLEKPSLDRNGKTNVEDDVGFEAETQLNVRLEKPSLDKSGRTNVEDDVGFEAETQLNVRLEKPSLDKNGRLNVEDEVGFEAETQLNVRLEKPSLDRNGKTNVEDEVGFEAETQLNVRLEKPSLDKSGRTNVEDDVGFEAETQLNVGLEKPSLDRNGRTSVEDKMRFEAETQLNLQIMKPKLCGNESIHVEDRICEAETQPNLKILNPRLNRNNRTNVENKVKMNKSTKLREEELNEKCISVADMEICSTVGQNVYISTILTCESTKKKLLNDKPCDTLNQSIFFNEPCSSSTPFKPFHNVNSTQVIKTNNLHTPKRKPSNEVLSESPILPSTEDLIAVADKTPEYSHKSNLNSQRNKNDYGPLIVNRTPRAKRMARKMAEYLHQVKEEETNCNEQSSAVLKKVTKNQKDSEETKPGCKKGVVGKLKKELSKADFIEKNNSNELAENPDDFTKLNLMHSYVKIEKYCNESYQESLEKKQNSRTFKSEPKIDLKPPTKEQSSKTSTSQIDDLPPLNQNEKQIKKSKRIAQIATNENVPNRSKKENKTKTKDVTVAKTNGIKQEVTCKNSAEENLLNKEYVEIIVEKSEKKTNGSIVKENEVRSELEDNQSHKDLNKLSEASPRKSSRSKKGNLTGSELHKDQLSLKEVKVLENKRNVESDTSKEESTHPLYENEKQLKKSRRIAKIAVNDTFSDQSKKRNKSKSDNVVVPKN